MTTAALTTTPTSDTTSAVGTATEPQSATKRFGRRRTGGLAARAAGFLQRRVDRRGLLRRGAMAGTALAVAPTDWVMRPMSAYAAVCGRGALCNDGYTEFCCALYGANRCPSGTLLAGWWKVDGHEFCGGGPRYYMDCNAGCGGCGCGGNGVCSGSCSGTHCGCARGDCNNRKAGCTAFRYGQCNNHVRCVGPIVCRVVTCTQPWMLDGSCTTSVRTDNKTRYHHRPCLAVDATGRTDRIQVVPGGVRVSGWAVDPGTSAPLAVAVYSCLQPKTILRADLSRPDLAGSYPQLGPNHGFDGHLRLCPGEQLISVAAFDTSGQGFTWLGHKMITVAPQTFGHLDLTTATAPKPGARDGSVRVVGFAIDIDAFRSSNVQIRVDNKVVRTVTAGRFRSDIEQAFPHLGGNYGFDESVPVRPGRHEICVIALNINSGHDVELGCNSVVVPANPTGVLESANSTGPGTLRVTGWASDADTKSSIYVRVTLDGEPAGEFLANAARGDGHTGHGFDVTLTGITPGEHTVCVTAENVGGGSDIGLGCMNAAVAAVTPGTVTQLEAAPGGMMLSATSIKRTDGNTNAVLRVLVDGHYRASIRPGTAGTTEFLALEPGAHEVQVLATIDGPRTVPVLLASALLDVPPASDGQQSAGGTPSNESADIPAGDRT